MLSRASLRTITTLTVHPRSQCAVRNSWKRKGDSNQMEKIGDKFCARYQIKPSHYDFSFLPSTIKFAFICVFYDGGHMVCLFPSIMTLSLCTEFQKRSITYLLNILSSFAKLDQISFRFFSVIENTRLEFYLLLWPWPWVNKCEYCI